MTYKIVKPNYNKSIVNISNSILKYYDLPTPHKTIPKLDKILIKKYKNIAYIIFDGMGSQILKNHLKSDDFLIKNKILDLTSVFPSTTGAAIPSIETGLTPVEHGWLAWSCYFKEYNRYIELFKNKDYYTKEYINTVGGKIANTIMKYEHIVDKISSKVDSYEIYPSFKENGFETIEKAFIKLTALCKKPEKKFIYMYWDNPDKLLHKTGCKSVEVNSFIKTINNQSKNLKLKDTLIIITADHGLIDIPKENYIFINEIKEFNDCLIIPPTFKGSYMSFFVKYDKRKFFKEKFNEILGGDFLLINKKDYINKYLGIGKGIIHNKVDDFVGDFVAVGISNKSLEYKTLNSAEKHFHIATHGGLTEDEMLVPLIIISDK